MQVRLSQYFVYDASETVHIHFFISFTTCDILLIVNSMGDELNSLIRECYPQASTIERERIAFDLQNLQFALPHMQLTLEPYTSDRGDTRMLIKAFVTIPITFKGGRYNIPVDIWISEGYPRYPPKVYVAPTSDMQIKQGHKHVDVNGLV